MALPGFPSRYKGMGGGGEPVTDENGMPVANLRR